MPASNLVSTVACSAAGATVTATLTYAGQAQAPAFVCYLYNAGFMAVGSADGTGRVFTFDAVPNGTFTLLVEDNAAPGSGPYGGTQIATRLRSVSCSAVGLLIDTFTDADDVTHPLYYNTPDSITDYPSPAATPRTMTEQERGRAEGDLITSFCESTTKVEIFAHLFAPYATVTRTANSADCGASSSSTLRFVSVTPVVPLAGQTEGGVSVVVEGGAQPRGLNAVRAGYPVLNTNVDANGNATLSGLAVGVWVIGVVDSGVPPLQQSIFQQITVPEAPAVDVPGCMDELAGNFNPSANVSQPDLCQYAPRWSGVWAREGIPVTATPIGSPLPAYLEAELSAGFPAGHPLAAARPMGMVARLRATVSPRTGQASFDVAPYLRPLLGALQSDGTRRLDVNSYSAHDLDLFTGYQLRVDGVLLGHGYALNSGLSEQQLLPYAEGKWLTPFAEAVPVWPGFGFPISRLEADAGGRYGLVESRSLEAYLELLGQVVNMPCPSNPVPVCWLSAEGGYGYWVFSGRPRVGDEIGEGSRYTEALSGEQRYSQHGESRRTVELSSGPFGGRSLVEGLRSLRRALQVWYQPEADGPWVPVLLGIGSFPAYQLGRHRYEFNVTLTEAQAITVQGQ